MSKEKLKCLGYDEKWITYGFLSEKELDRQYDLYIEALKDPENDLYGNGYTEHLRHRSFLNIAEESGFLSDIQLTHLVELIHLDSDQGMAESGLQYILKKGRNTEAQLGSQDF